MNKLVKILLSWLALFALASGSMTLTGCSKDDDSVNPDLVTYDIRLDVNLDAIQDQKLKNLANQINNKKEVSHKEVSRLFHQFHAHDLEASALSEFVKTISSELKGTDSFARKTEYEAKIEEMAGAELMYNSSASTVAHIMMNNRMQCYSGTALNMMVNRELEEGQAYEAQNYVAIFQAGHVLPGKMIKVDNQWVLIGIESTATGVATYNLGLASEIEYGKTRVVDASYFMLIEMYKAYLQSPTSAADTAIEQTAEKYGIDLQNYGPHINNWLMGTLDSACENSNSPFDSPVNVEATVDYTEAKINLSPFGFGCSSVRDDEDKPRNSVTGIGSSLDEITAVSLDEIKALRKNQKNKDEGIGVMPPAITPEEAGLISIQGPLVVAQAELLQEPMEALRLIDGEVFNQIDVVVKDEDNFNVYLLCNKGFLPTHMSCDLFVETTCSTEPGEHKAKLKWVGESDDISKEQILRIKVTPNKACNS